MTCSRTGFIKKVPPSNGTSLLALVGGTQQLAVTLDSIDIKGRSYTATLDLTLYDDFGVNVRDFVRPTFPASSGQRGLTALWMLQYQRGYRPFRTVFRFRHVVRGTF